MHLSMHACGGHRKPTMIVLQALPTGLALTKKTRLRIPGPQGSACPSSLLHWITSESHHGWLHYRCFRDQAQVLVLARHINSLSSSLHLLFKFALFVFVSQSPRVTSGTPLQRECWQRKQKRCKVENPAQQKSGLGYGPHASLTNLFIWESFFISQRFHFLCVSYQNANCLAISTAFFLHVLKIYMEPPLQVNKRWLLNVGEMTQQ